jgi:hypothetical protein
VVGIPYPNAFNRSIKAKKTYNDEQRKIHGRQDICPATSGIRSRPIAPLLKPWVGAFGMLPTMGLW